LYIRLSNHLLIDMVENKQTAFSVSDQTAHEDGSASREDTSPAHNLCYLSWRRPPD